MKRDKHPGGRPRRPVDLIEAGRLLAARHSLRQTARTLGLGNGTLHRAVQAAERGPEMIQNSKEAIL